MLFHYQNSQGMQTSNAFTQAENAAPTRHSIMFLFPQQLPYLSLFLPLEYNPTPQTIH